MIHIAICDDEQSHGKMLEKNISLFCAENRINAQLAVYEHSSSLYYDISEGRHFDLLLSDIEMPEMNGMELAKSVKKYLPDMLIIFITGYVRYAVDAYELSVFRYIPKSELDKRLPQALADAAGMLQLQAELYYTIQTATKHEKIPLNKILYIRREGKNSLIVQTGGKISKVRKSLAGVYDEINSDDFLFAGRSDIVNIIYIMSLKNGILEMKNGERIPIGQSSLNEIKNKLNEFWGKHL